MLKLYALSFKNRDNRELAVIDEKLAKTIYAYTSIGMAFGIKDKSVTTITGEKLDADNPWICNIIEAGMVYSLSELYNELNKAELTDGYVETRSYLYGLIEDYIKDGISCAQLLESLEDNTDADYFIYDIDSGICNQPAVPIWNVADLIFAIFPQCKPTKKDDAVSFLSDQEKMYDFVRLTKEEFLASYSYLTEDEYDATLTALDELIKSYQE